MVAPFFRLTMRSGPTPGEAYLLELEETILGRDQANDIAISDPEVSRRHARFVIKDGNLIVEDLGSTNGTFLNGERISSPQQLRAGDVITLGETIVLVFEKANYDPDATVVASQADLPVQPAYQERTPAPEPYHPAPAAHVQPQPSQQSAMRPQQVSADDLAKGKKGGFPTWLIILIIAVVVIVCVISVIMWFMPASWWCAITFDSLAGCPIL